MQFILFFGIFGYVFILKNEIKNLLKITSFFLKRKTKISVFSSKKVLFMYFLCDMSFNFFLNIFFIRFLLFFIKVFKQFYIKSLKNFYIKKFIFLDFFSRDVKSKEFKNFFFRRFF